MGRTELKGYDPLTSVSLDRTSPVPLYYQLARHLEEQIHAGSLRSGDRIENEVKIAEDLGLSRPTVRQAFRYLVDKGMVVRRRGLGTVVAEEKVSRPVMLTSLYDDLAAAGKSPETQVLKNEVVKASDLVREALGLAEGERAIFLERLRFGGGEPIALMHNYLPTSLITLSTEMLQHHGLYELLRQAGTSPSRAHQRVSARSASAAEARLLHDSKGAALLTMERTSFDEEGRAIEFAQHVYRGSRYTLSSVVSA